jgi:hypothetical protein
VRTARALALLRQGTPVRLYECAEGWCRVTVSRLSGYVLEEFLTKQPQPIAQSSPPGPLSLRERGNVQAGASAKCRDGTFSFSQSRRGTC